MKARLKVSKSGTHRQSSVKNSSKTSSNNKLASKSVRKHPAPLTPSQLKLVLFNKPMHVMCQFTDQENRQTLKDYINVPNVYAAGRLDYDSEGLLVLTNDGKLIHQISNPKNKMSKTYWVQVEGCPSEADLQNLRDGVMLKDGQTLPAKANIMSAPSIWPRNPPIRERQNKPTSWLSLTLNEGKNRQVRRMTAHIGFPTLRLIRYRIGNWTIDGIASGEFVLA